MRPIGPDLATEQQELSDLLANRAESDWALATRCEGWTVADVVLHLAQTNEAAIASITGRGLTDAMASFAGPTASGTVDDRVEAMVTAERGASPPEIRRRWQSGVDALERAVAEADPRARVPWVAGELTVRTLATTRLAETWIHAGDVANAVGVQRRPTERLWHVARLAWRTLPYAFARAGRELTGPVAMDLRSPSGEAWVLEPEAPAATVIRGKGEELCLVAARRLAPDATGLVGEGPDGETVLELVRTYA